MGTEIKFSYIKLHKIWGEEGEKKVRKLLRKGKGTANDEMYWAKL